MVFLLIAIVLTALFGISWIVVSERKKAKARMSGIRSKRSGLIPLTTYLRWFKRLDESFLTRGSFQKVKTRIADLSIYSAQEIQVYAVRVYVISITCSAVLLVAGALIFKDVFSTLLVLLYAIVMNNVVVGKQVDSVHYRLLKQMSMALSSLRLHYLRLNSISQAIAETETGNSLRRAFEDISAILTDVDGKKKLDEFYAKTPFKLLCTLAGVCYILNNAGDSKLRDGSSNFLQAMGMLAEEVNLEIRRITLQKARFGMLEYLPIVPLLAIGVIEGFFTSIIPGTSVLYHGTIGYVSRVVILLASIVGYTVIVRVNSAVSVKKDDRNPLVMRALRIPWFARLVDEITPKKSFKRLRKLRALKGALSMTNLKHLYGSKILYAAAAFLFALVCFFFAVQLGKQFVYDNVREVSLIGGEKLTAKDIQIRRELDRYYLSLPKLPTENETKLLVQQRLPDLQAYDQDAQLKRLMEKYRSYHNAYFKWWMVVVSFGIACAFYYLPELLLRARSALLKTESEEDVLQMQTLISILMNTSCDTLETLYWLMKQSRVHKNALVDAFHEYPSNPDLALNRLKAKAVLPSFRRMVDKLLLTVHQIRLDEAFSDLVTEREHVLRIREISQTTTLNKKRGMVSPLAMAPLVLTAVLYILVPLGILGFREFKNALQQMNM